MLRFKAEIEKIKADAQSAFSESSNTTQLLRSQHSDDQKTHEADLKQLESDRLTMAALQTQLDALKTQLQQAQAPCMEIYILETLTLSPTSRPSSQRAKPSMPTTWSSTNRTKK